MRTILTIVTAIVLAAGFINCREEVKSNSSIGYPHLRVMCTDDVQQLVDTHAKFSIVQPLSFGSGQPWVSYPQREGFNEAIHNARKFTDEGHNKGFTYISYISKTISGGPTPEELPLVKIYEENRWAEYEDYFGPTPPKSPLDWIEKRADGSLGGYTWVSPSGKAGFHSFACANNPYFHRYMKGVVKALIEMGIDGFYMDHTEGKGCYCEYCDSGFRDFLKQEYPDKFVTWKYKIANNSDLEIPKSDKDALWIEWRKYISFSQVKIHQILKDEASRLGDQDFIVSGNLFGAGGFGFAALNGSDIEMAGDVDVILYSEIVSSTTNKKEAYYTIPGFRDDQRISNSPLYKHMAIAHHQEPVLVYPYYPESPNPVELESALYNQQRLIVAETFANHTSMRRVQKNHVKPVIDGSSNVYAFLAKLENMMNGAELYSNVAVLTSLNQFYHGEYSYIYSASRMLNDAGISHVMITEKELTPSYLEKVDILILPYIPLMSDVSEKEIQVYLQNGGTLILIGPCGIKDQYGVAKEKSLLMSMIEEENLQNETVKNKVGKGSLIFLPVESEQLNQFSSLLQTYNNDESEGYAISIFQHDVFGKGMFHDHLVDTWAQMPDLIKWAVKDNLTGIISTPQKAELTTMVSPDDNNIFAHVLNYQVTEQGEITLLEESKISLRIPANRSVKKITFGSLNSPDPVPLEYNIVDKDKFNLVEIIIKNLELYGIACVELE